MHFDVGLAFEAEAAVGARVRAVRVALLVAGKDLLVRKRFVTLVALMYPFPLVPQMMYRNMFLQPAPCAELAAAAEQSALAAARRMRPDDVGADLAFTPVEAFAIVALVLFGSVSMHPSDMLPQ